MTGSNRDQRTEIVTEQATDRDADTKAENDGLSSTSSVDRSSETTEGETDASYAEVVIEVGDESDGATKPAPFTVVVDGQSVQVDTETTVTELGRAIDAGEDAVFTYRTEDGVEALSGEETLSEAVAEGTELWTQPLGDGEVFGDR